MPLSSTPSFKLSAVTGTSESTLSARDLAGNIVVLYVYPKDDTPGCTREAQAFQSSLKQFEKLGAKVVGVSRDTTAKHLAFAKKYSLAFPLLSDPELTLHKALEAWGQKTMYGKKIEGVLRTTVVFDMKGKVAKVFRNVKVDGHVDAVLDVIRALATGASGGSGKATPAAKPERSAAKKVAAKTVKKGGKPGSALRAKKVTTTKK